MTDRARFRPFTNDPERKVHMPNAPLALVLAQVRWPEHARFTRDFRSLALDFGDQLADFPLFEEVVETGLQITPEGVKPISGETAYQWRSIDNVWFVHLTKRFVSIYCIRHENYEFAELRAHLVKIAGLLGNVLQVRTIERIGIRYVNRITDEVLISRLSTVFNPAVLGYEQLEPARSSGMLVSNFNQAVYRAEEVVLNVRSGMLVAGETMDPAVVPVDRPSWVLDLDASVEQGVAFDVESLDDGVGRLADTAYDFFKSVLLENAEQQLDGTK